MAQQESVKICRGFSVEQWRRLKDQLVLNDQVKDDEAAWRCAVKVFERRIREHFLLCIERLQDDDPKAGWRVAPNAPADCSTLPPDNLEAMVPGFCIMALCCLLVETLDSFRGTQRGTKKAFERFLQRPAFRGAFSDSGVAADFAHGIRDGIVHDAETRGWLIMRAGPAGHIVKDSVPRILYRTAFYRALKTEFEDYLRELRNKENTELRRAFIKKMDEIADRC